MATGTVKWFNETKGYGFIAPDEGGADVFLHISELEKTGHKSVPDGQKIEFEVVMNRGKQAAGEIKLL